MINPLKSFIHKAGRSYIRKVCGSEADSQTFSHQNERPVEYGFALDALRVHQPKTVLDVGTGTTAWPALLRNCGFVVTAIDNVTDYWPEGMVNRHWTIADVDITQPNGFAARRFDALTCISVLEHIEDHQAAMRQMLSLLNPQGILVLTCPYNEREFSPNVYQRPDALYGQDAAYICRSYSSRELAGWLSLGAALEKKALWRGFTGPVWATGARLPLEPAVLEDQPHQLGCFVLRKN